MAAGALILILLLTVLFTPRSCAQVPAICEAEPSLEICDCKHSSSDPNRNCYDGIPDPSEETPVNLTVAFIGDQGITTGAKAVLSMVRAEGVEVVFHAGDFDYVNNPQSWETQINQILGPNFPYISAIGNHDLPQWPSYASLIRQRYQKFGAKCWGDIGRDSVCSYKGVVVAISGVGTSSAFNQLLLAQACEAFPSNIPVCMWHKNQRNMQLGGKSDETGYTVYQTCGTVGAFIVTGHEHSYARTKSMIGYGTIPEWEEVPKDPLTGDQLPLEPGKSVTVVTGIAGHSLRPCTQGKEFNGWWGSAICTTSDPPLTSYGAVICKFNYNGNKNQAYCELKMIDGRVMDKFLLISHHTRKQDKPVGFLNAIFGNFGFSFAILCGSIFFFILVALGVFYVVKNAQRKPEKGGYTLLVNS